ncbi:MAG: hypothetical protein OSB21_05030 [Myxococcota bacterium]|jgi:hypothetical protein|nr:hypothetical protein [Myxococcota bacterium]
MSKRSDQKTITTTRVDSAAEKVLRMRHGKSVGDKAAVGPVAGLKVETLSELERIQAEVLAGYGMKESAKSQIVSRLKQLDDD